MFPVAFRLIILDVDRLFKQGASNCLRIQRDILPVLQDFAIVWSVALAGHAGATNSRVTGVGRQ